MNLNQSKMTLKKYYRDSVRLAEALDKACIELDNKYNINNGGCCYVAYVLFKLLEKDGLNPILIINDYSDYLDENDIEYNLKYSHYHYCVKICNKYINYIDDGEDLDYVEIPNISAKEVLNLYKNGSWNRDYDKSLNKKIAKILKTKYFGITSNIRKRRSKNKGK